MTTHLREVGIHADGRRAASFIPLLRPRGQLRRLKRSGKRGADPHGGILIGPSLLEHCLDEGARFQGLFVLRPHKNAGRNDEVGRNRRRGNRRVTLTENIYRATLARIRPLAHLVDAARGQPKSREYSVAGLADHEVALIRDAPEEGGRMKSEA